MVSYMINRTAQPAPAPATPTDPKAVIKTRDNAAQIAGIPSVPYDPAAAAATPAGPDNRVSTSPVVGTTRTTTPATTPATTGAATGGSVPWAYAPNPNAGAINTALQQMLGSFNGAAGPQNAFSPAMMEYFKQQALKNLATSNQQAMQGIAQSQAARGIAGPNVASIMGNQLDATRQSALANMQMEAEKAGQTLGLQQYQAQTAQEGMLGGLAGDQQARDLQALLAGVKYNPETWTPTTYDSDQMQQIIRDAGGADASGNITNWGAAGNWTAIDPQTGAVVDPTKFTGTVNWQLDRPSAEKLGIGGTLNPGGYTTAEERTAGNELAFKIFQQQDQTNLAKWLQTQEGQQAMDRLNQTNDFQQFLYEKTVADQAQATTANQAQQQFQTQTDALNTLINNVRDQIIQKGAGKKERDGYRALLEAAQQQVQQAHDVWAAASRNAGSTLQIPAYQPINFQTMFDAFGLG